MRPVERPSHLGHQKWTTLEKFSEEVSRELDVSDIVFIEKFLEYFSKNSSISKRLLLLYLVYRNKSCSLDLISAETGLSRQAIYYWIEKFSKGGIKNILGRDIYFDNHNDDDLAIYSLTKYERQTIEFIAQEMNVKKISDMMNCSPSTTYNRISKIREKLQCRDIAAWLRKHRNIDQLL